MNNRERLFQLLDYVPDDKLPYVIGFMQGLLIADIPEIVNFDIDENKSEEEQNA